MRIDPKLIIAVLKRNDDRIRQTAQELCISPGTVRLWRKRASTGDLRFARRYSTRNLARHSTAPKRRPCRALTTRDQDLILSMRSAHGFGAVKLTAYLGLSCHPKTVERFLASRGLLASGKTYRRPKYQQTTHMHARNATHPGKLQMDVKVVTPELSGLVHTSYLYAVMDIYSRYKQGLVLPLLDQRLAIQALQYLIPDLPFTPDFIQTDNGLEFQTAFHEYVTSLGWDHHYIHKSSPNENAVIERSFRTDEEEFFWRAEPSIDLTQLNLQYQTYINFYNSERPHFGLNLKTPLQQLESFQSVQ